MRYLTSLAALLSAATVAVATPAVAKPSHPSTKHSHPSTKHQHPSTKHQHPSTSHKCRAHRVAYRASGTLVSFSATKTGKDRYTGTITVHVTSTNHHARTDKNGDVTYTLTNTIVRFGRGTSPSDTTKDRVTVIGKITELAKKCDHTGFTPTVTVRKVDVLPARGKSHR